MTGETGAPEETVEGAVKWFDAEKGFGFVELSDGSGDAFLHANVLEARRYASPQPGTWLRGRAVRGPKGRQITEILELSGASPGARFPGVKSPEAEGGRPARRPERAPPARRAGPAPRPLATVMLGTVRWFDSGKGFGFVQADDGGSDVFVHASTLERTCMAPPAEGQRVMILVVEGAKGREATSIAPAD